MLRARIIKARRDLRVDVSLELHPGASLALLGVSGAGKSTVLSCIAGVESPDDGYVTFNASTFYPPNLAVHRRRIGYMTQEPGLFPHLPVNENVTFGLSAEELSRKEMTLWIAALKDRLHLAPIWTASVLSLSGGQAHRVALARMLARKPPLVLLDEPFAGLDRHLVRELIEDLLLWSQTLGFSMIVVDHQVEVLRRLCPDEVMVLENGRVLQQGSWATLYQSPATPLLQSLLDPL